MESPHSIFACIGTMNRPAQGRVAQTSGLLYRRLPVGRRPKRWGARISVEPAGWKHRVATSGYGLRTLSRFGTLVRLALNTHCSPAARTANEATCMGTLAMVLLWDILMGL